MEKRKRFEKRETHSRIFKMESVQSEGLGFRAFALVLDLRRLLDVLHGPATLHVDKGFVGVVLGVIVVVEGVATCPP